MSTAVGTALLDVEELWAGYGPVQVLHGVTFHVNEGEVVVILGANGAGKTTTLRAICQMINTRGRVELEGASLNGKSTTTVVRKGVAHVPQGRGTFPELSVRDNLEVGAYVRRDRDINADIDRWFDAFPRLAERRTQLAGSLSGGEQQMLAIARALVARPTLLMLDEPSLGLAPRLVRQIFGVVADLKREGVTIVLVEQNARQALAIADRAYILEAGQMVLSGPAAELAAGEAVQRAYLGGPAPA
jgi:branched-chain amino acid transport system ATP-binding protein